MELNQQLEFLTKLGQRLDLWVRPGDPEDRLTEGVPLIDGPVAAMQFPMRVSDVLKARWIRVRDYSTQKPVPLFLGPAQRHFSANRSGKDIILKSGKTWFTTDAIADAFLRAITIEGYGALLVAHELDPAKDYFTAAHFMWRSLPGALGKILRDGGALSTKTVGGRANVRELFFPHLNSRYFVETAKDAAAGLGQSYQGLHCTELSRWTGNVKQTLATLGTHQVGDRQSKTLESRPHGDTGFFYEEYQRALRGENDFRAHFYHWWWNPQHRKSAPAGFKLTEDEAKLCARYSEWRATVECELPAELPLEQVVWRREQEKDYGMLREQEFAEDSVACFLGSGNCPFSAQAMAEALKDAPAPVEKEIAPGTEENGWLCWELPQEGEEYLLFGDVSGALGKSRLALELIKRSTGAQVGEWVGRESALAFAARCRRIGMRFNRALIALETNLGDISATAYAGLAGYPNLFWRQEASGGRKLGWKTDAVTRPMMFETLGEVLTAAPHLFRSRRLIADMKIHVLDGDRIEPKAGFGGDLTIAAAGAWSMRKRPKPAKPWVEIISVR